MLGECWRIYNCLVGGGASTFPIEHNQKIGGHVGDTFKSPINVRVQVDKLDPSSSERPKPFRNNIHG